MSKAIASSKTLYTYDTFVTDFIQSFQKQRATETSFTLGGHTEGNKIVQRQGQEASLLNLTYQEVKCKCNQALSVEHVYPICIALRTFGPQKFISNKCRYNVQSLRYNSMQNSKQEGSLKHTLRAPLRKFMHYAHPAKEYKNTIGNPFG